MGWLKKILGREGSYDQWLEKHPGKQAMSAPPAAAAQEQDEYERKTRANMEQELDAQRTGRADVKE